MYGGAHARVVEEDGRVQVDFGRERVGDVERVQRAVLW